MKRLIGLFLMFVMILPVLAGCSRPPRQGEQNVPVTRTEIIEEEHEIGRESRPVLESDR
ncbi:MAG: hypothetical protein ACYS8W_15035 [Planctomycetota bacterium]|jgi:hypothetical protein